MVRIQWSSTFGYSSSLSRVPYRKEETPELYYVRGRRERKREV